MDDILRLIAAHEEDFPDRLLEARRRLRERLDAKEEDGEALALLAEVQYWLGTHAVDERAKEALLANGVACGERAAELLPDSVAANFWCANCMAAHGTLRGMVNSLGYLEPLEIHGNRAVELDETYLDAAPLRLMGRFYCQAPPAPVGCGDRKRGLELAKRAVDLAPDHLHNRVVLADAYLSARYFEQGRLSLREVLAAPEPATNRMSHALYRAEALRILERLERME